MGNIPRINDHHAKSKRHSETLATPQLKPNPSDTNIHGATPNIPKLPNGRASMANTPTPSLHGRFLSIHSRGPAQKPKAPKNVEKH